MITRKKRSVHGEHSHILQIWLHDTNDLSFEYGKIIEIVVIGQKPDLPAPVKGVKSKAIPKPQQTFFVYEYVLTPNMKALSKLVSHSRYKHKCEIPETHPNHFKIYLDWIHDGVLTPSYVDGRGESLIVKLGGKTHPDDRDGIIVSELCKLLVLNDTLQDKAFHLEVWKCLDTFATNKNLAVVPISVLDAEKLWPILQRYGQFHPKGVWLRGRIPGWTVPGLTRDKIEERSATMDAALLATLRKLVPVMVSVSVGHSKEQVTITVDRDAMARCSTTIAKTLQTALLSTDRGFNWTGYGGLVPRSGGAGVAVVSSWLRSIGTTRKEQHDLFVGYERRETYSRVDPTPACQMAILAEKLGDTRVQYPVMTFLLSVSDGVWASYWRQIAALIGNNTSPDSGLRRWVVDMIAAETDIGGLKTFGKDIPSTLLLELLIKREEIKVKTTLGTHVGPRLSDIDKYCTPSFVIEQAYRHAHSPDTALAPTQSGRAMGPEWVHIPHNTGAMHL